MLDGGAPDCGNAPFSCETPAHSALRFSRYPSSPPAILVYTGFPKMPSAARITSEAAVVPRIAALRNVQPRFLILCLRLIAHPPHVEP